MAGRHHQTQKTNADRTNAAIRVEIRLRSTQRRYLDHLAELDLSSKSQAFRNIMESYAPDEVRQEQLVQHRPPRKTRQSVVLTPYLLSMMDRLAAMWGVDRSEVARRLIDRAQKDDPIILS